MIVFLWPFCNSFFLCNPSKNVIVATVANIWLNLGSHCSSRWCLTRAGAKSWKDDFNTPRYVVSGFYNTMYCHEWHSPMLPHMLLRGWHAMRACTMPITEPKYSPFLPQVPSFAPPITLDMAKTVRATAFRMSQSPCWYAWIMQRTKIRWKKWHYRLTCPHCLTMQIKTK